MWRSSFYAQAGERSLQGWAATYKIKGLYDPMWPALDFLPHPFDYAVIHCSHQREGTAMSVTTVRLQAEVEQHLEAIASRLHRSKGWVINQALSEYIERQQLEQERWKQTLEAMESAAQGKVVDASEVHSWLNSWGTENEQDAPRSGK